MLNELRAAFQKLSIAFIVITQPDLNSPCETSRYSFGGCLPDFYVDLRDLNIALQISWVFNRIQYSVYKSSYLLD